MKWSLRSLAKMVKYLDRLYIMTDVDAFNKVAIGICNCVYIAGFEVEFKSMIEEHGSAKFMNEEPMHHPDAQDVVGFWKIGSIIIYGGKETVGFRTHVIRHRSMLVNDELFSEFKTAGTLLPGIQIKQSLKIQLAASKEIWDHVISTRACWIAQGSLWSGIVEKYREFMNQERPVLPCDEKGDCPFKIDNIARINKKDPNPPCPIFMKTEKQEIDSKTNYEIVKHAINKPAWWDPFILNHESWNV